MILITCLKDLWLFLDLFGELLVDLGWGCLFLFYCSSFEGSFGVYCLCMVVGVCLSGFSAFFRVFELVCFKKILLRWFWGSLRFVFLFVGELSLCFFDFTLELVGVS